MKKFSLTTALALLCTIGMWAQQYDFTAVSGGNTLYYKITDADAKEVAVVSELDEEPYNNTKPTGALTIPTIVEHNSIDYSVTSIGDYAFHDCSDLTGTLTIPNGVTSIGDLAFWSCSGFAGTLTIPNSVESIGIGAFTGCSSLTELNLLATTPPTLVSDPFYIMMRAIYVPEGTLAAYTAADSWKDMVGTYHFVEKGKEMITINVATAGTLWDELDAIGKHPSAVYRLKLIGTLGTDDWNLIKSNMTSLYDLDLSEITNTSIPDEAFKYSKILLFKFPQELTSIGNSAFAYSYLVGELLLPSSLTHIGDYAFTSCYGLTGSLTIPNSVNSIGIMAFGGCFGLNNTIKLPDSLRSVILGSFDYLSNITHVIIPAEVNSIGVVAFGGCTALDTITCYAVEPPSVDATSFEQVPNTCLLRVPMGAKKNYARAAVWGNFLNIQEVDMYYTVTFNSSNGEGNMSEQLVIKGDSSSITENIFTKEGHAFIGWATDSTSTTAEYTDGKNITLTENIELYAVWEVSTYTLSFDANGGVGTANDTIITYNDAIGTLPVLTKDGYTFDSWKIGNDEIADTTVWVFTQDKEAIAQWVANKYTLSFDANGGTGTMDAQIFTYDIASAITTNTFTKEGYTFKGWATDSTATTAEYTDSAEITLTEDVELYAVWEEASSIGDAQIPAPFTQAGSTLYFGEPTDIAVYNVSGIMLYNGAVSEYTLPSKIGIYIICTEVGSFKVISN